VVCTFVYSNAAEQPPLVVQLCRLGPSCPPTSRHTSP
jgi:hypothetical protein